MDQRVLEHNWQTWDGADVIPPELSNHGYLRVDVRTAAGGNLWDIEAGELRWFWVDKKDKRHNPAGNIVAWRLALHEDDN